MPGMDEVDPAGEAQHSFFPESMNVQMILLSPRWDYPPRRPRRDPAKPVA